MSPDDEYQPPTNISRDLDVPLRTLERWANDGRIRTQPSPIRKRAKLYNRADAERLAASLVRQREPAEPADTLADVPAAGVELVPLSDMLQALNRKDNQLAEANQQLQRAALEIGTLRGQLESQQKLLEAAQDSETRRLAAEAERDRLRQAIERLPRWIRLLWLRR